ncbi:hypothetical protein UlMin_009766, partial [Ulmus minor]
MLLFHNLYLIKSLAFLGLVGFSLHLLHRYGNPRKRFGQTSQEGRYSVWAIPPEDVVDRLKKLMEGFRDEFGGPQFQPHITVVRAINLMADDALSKFRSTSGTFFYQCVYLLHPTTELLNLIKVAKKQSFRSMNQ